MVTPSTNDPIDERPVDGSAMIGWSKMAVRAACRNLKWTSIVSELVDNALANAKQDVTCRVQIEWHTDRGGKTFCVVDNGRGCSDPEAFLRPGKTGGNRCVLGNSTFGSGLFVVECIVESHMQIASDPSDGRIYLTERRIWKEDQGKLEEYLADPKVRAKYKIPEGGGTSLWFMGYAKPGPSRDGVEGVAREIGRCYARAITAGELEVGIRLNRARFPVEIDPRPDLIELQQEKVQIDGHTFSVEWGVTKEPVQRCGVNLVYGSKMFDTTAEPCGTGSLGRFYGEIAIPLSIGASIMDLLKRNHETEAMRDLFTRCYEIFRPALEESDRLCGQQADNQLTDLLKRMLSAPKQTRKGPNGGDADKRDFNGRDLGHKGAEPKDTGRRRGGRSSEIDVPKIPRRPRGSRVPDDMAVDWVGLGPDQALAVYDVAGRRLTYNIDNDDVAKWRHDKDRARLIDVAAAHIAHAIDGTDEAPTFGFGEGSFPDIYRQMVHRAGIGGLE